MRISDDILLKKYNSKSYLLINTRYRHYLKIDSNTYDLLMLIKDDIELTELANLLSQKNDRYISPEYLNENIIKKLIPYGVFVGYDKFIIQNTKPSYLKLSFTIIPTFIVDKIAHWLIFLFNAKVFIILIILSCSILAYGTYLNYNILLDMRIDKYWLILISFFISITFHEFGHATAAKHFGANHNGIGGGFYLFHPVYYADVTDIWRLSKYQRVIVDLSGIYFEFIFCSFVTLISILTNECTLFILAIIILSSTVYNLNPFIRSDGYWAIIDITDETNIFNNPTQKLLHIYSCIRKHGLRYVVSIKNIIILLYAFFSYVFQITFIYYAIIYNPKSILLFPINVYNYIVSIVNGDYLTVQTYLSLLMPLTFYILIFNYVKNKIKTYKNRHENSSNILVGS